MGPIAPDERAQVMAASPVRGLYDQPRDRESAFEVLQGRAARVAEPAAAAPTPRAPAPPRASNRQGMGEAFAKSRLRTIGSTVGREIIRGVLGGMRRRR